MSSHLPRGSKPILYATFDGVLQPLAFSQVVRVVTALARRGVPYHLLSVERKADLERRDETTRVARVLAEAGVPWTVVPVDLSRSIRRSGEAFSRVVAKVLSLMRHDPPALFHARGYQAGAAAHLVRKITGMPYLFDARGCWIEERQDWFARPSVYAAAKLVERKLYADAAAVVTLTELHADEVVDGAFGKKDRAKVVAIPTCADYSEFDVAARLSRSAPDDIRIPSAVRKDLEGKIVLGIVGALNRSYLTEPTMLLVKLVCDLLPEAHLLVLTQQRDEYAALTSAHGISPERTTFASVHHEDIPAWLSWIDFGLLLLADTIAKRGSMPTKLGEFFAAGVRPIAYGCNLEMVNWVRRAGSGIVLDGIEPASLLETARRIARDSRGLDALNRARAITAPHFSLRSGIDRYEALFRSLGFSVPSTVAVSETAAIAAAKLAESSR